MALDERVAISVGPQGRIVIPVALRSELGLMPGQVLIGHVENGRLILERREDVLSRLQDRFTAAIPRGISLADELICERREEARHEMQDE